MNFYEIPGIEQTEYFRFYNPKNLNKIFVFYFKEKTHPTFQYGNSIVGQLFIPKDDTGDFSIFAKHNHRVLFIADTISNPQLNDIQVKDLKKIGVRFEDIDLEKTLAIA